MILEIIGLVGGAVARLTPEVLNFFKEGRDLKYELLRMDKEVQLEQLRGLNKQAEIIATSDARVEEGWADGLVEAIKTTRNTGSKLMDALNASVRPILTYWWCLVLYTIQKGFEIYIAFKLDELTPALIVTSFDRAVIGSIMSFWFVDRALRKMTGLR